MTKSQKLFKLCVVSAVLAASAVDISFAGFTTNDLYLGFTQSTAQSDYIIDLGQPKKIGVGGSSVIDLGGFSLTTFTGVFTSGANGVAAAAVGGDNVFGQFGVYATQPRVGGAGNPAVPGSSISAGHTSSEMSGGAAQVSAIMSSTAGGLPAAGNSAVDSTKSYSSVVTTTGLAGNFIGRTGVIPFGTFDSSGILYLDLYHATTSSAYTYLGYFSLDVSTPAARLTFTPSTATGTAGPPPPPNLNLTRLANTTTISFLSSNAVSYSLLFTNSTGLGAPVSTWRSAPSSIIGDGTKKSFTDVTTDTDRLYRVLAH